MDKKKNFVCALINGNEEDLSRELLKEEFSKFGNITKVFISNDNAFAKVYLDDLEGIKNACKHLNGFRSWQVELYRDNYKQNFPSNNFQNNHSTLNSFHHQPNLNNFNISRGSNDDMEEDGHYAGEYVDIHGNLLDVVEGDDRHLYVNLDDLRKSGYNIYPKESFESAIIPRGIELRHFENYLLNQGKTYILKHKQRFDEEEMINVFERVLAKFQSGDSPSQGFGGREINAHSKNFTVTTKNTSTPSTSHSAQTPTYSQPRRHPHENREKKNERVPSNDNRWSQNNLKREGNDSQHNYKNGGNDRSSYERKSTGGGDWQPRKPRNSGGWSNSSPATPSQKEDVQEPWEDTNPVVEAIPKVKAPSEVSVEVVEAIPEVKAPSEASVEVVEVIPKVKAASEAAVQVVEAIPKVKAPSEASVERNLLNIKRVEIAPGSKCQVKVTYLNEDKKNLFYGQLLENQNLVQEILFHTNTTDNNLPEIAMPERHMLCVVLFEDVWYRAVVLRNRQGKVLVELIDFGNKEEITTPIREMSEEMKNIPGQVIRFAVHATTDSIQEQIEQELGLEVFVKKHYDDLTHLVELKRVVNVSDENADTPMLPNDQSLNVEDKKPSETQPAEKQPNEQPVEKTPAVANIPEKCFTAIPPSTVQVANGENIMIVNFTKNIIVLRNKQAALICKEVYNHIKEIQQKKPITDPKVGQYVLCSKNNIEGLHRAVIKSISGKSANLEFVDYYGGETLLLSSLRNFDEGLASLPSAKIESAYPVLADLTQESEEMLNNFVLQKTKLKVSFVDGELDFIINIGEKTMLLSKKIKEFKNPPPPPKKEPEVKEATSPVNLVSQAPTPAPTVSQDDQEEFVTVTLNEMPYVKAELGSGTYVCYTCKDNSVTLISLDPANSTYLSELLLDDLSDTVPHTPGMFEMCLAKFQGTWNRGLVTEDENGSYEVYFVDYGNIEKIEKSDIRRFPKRLAEVPILGIGAYFIGIPDDIRIQEKLQELIPDGTDFTVEIKEDVRDDDLKYGIEIPEIYQKLKELGLI